MTTPTLRDTSQALINILKELHYGRMPERVQTAFDAVQEALAAQPELPEPVGTAAELPGSRGGFTHAVFKSSDVLIGTKLYTEAQLQQAVEQERHRFGVIDALLKEYGLQAVDFVADFKQAQTNVATDAAQITRKFDELLGDYWDEAYEQGEEGRTQDTDGTAQKILSNLQALFTYALQTQAKREPMTREQMRDIFLANGFTIKEGQDDLKDYVYAAGRAIEAHHNIGDKA